MTRLGYTVAHVSLLIAYVVIAGILASVGQQGWVQIAAVAGFVAGWHAISARRIAEVGAPWLHLAPYVSLASAPFAMIYVGEQEAQSAPLHPIAIPWWHEPLGILCFAGLLVWPVATIVLSILLARANARAGRGRGAAVGAELPG